MTGEQSDGMEMGEMGEMEEPMDEPMDEAVDEAPAGDRRRWWIAGAALVGALAIVIAVGLLGDDDETDAVTTATDTSDVSTPTTETPPSSTGGPGSTAPASTATPSTLPSTVPASTVPASTVPASTVPPIDGPLVTVAVITGSLDTVVVDTVVPAPPVSMDDVADTGTGMTFRVEQLEAVQGEATGPGEIAAPAVRVTMVATNGGTQPVLMASVVVDLTSGDDNASSPPLSGPGVERFAGQLAPGASVTGVYVFDVPLDRRDRVSILVSYLASVSPVLFEGPAPTR